MSVDTIIIGWVRSCYWFSVSVLQTFTKYGMLVDIT